MANIDFNALFNIGRNIASNISNKNKAESKNEQNIFNVEGKKSASKNGVDASELHNNTSIASLMGVEINKTNPVNKMDNADELFEMAGIKKPEKEVVDRVSESAKIIDSINIEEIEEISPNDEVTFAYIDQHQNGTADRINNMGIVSADVIEFTEGDSSLLDISALLFRDAEYLREAS